MPEQFNLSGISAYKLGHCALVNPRKSQGKPAEKQNWILYGQIHFLMH
jgi:hypothetical protein